LRLSSNLLALGALALLIGCRPQKTGGLRLECDVQPQPLRVGPAEVEITLSDSHHAPVQGAQVALEADMSHPGMKPLFQNAFVMEGGKYRSSLNFDMPGDWILLLHAKLASGATVDNQIRLTVLEK
jgi:hypothetical protein